MFTWPEGMREESQGVGILPPFRMGTGCSYTRDVAHHQTYWSGKNLINSGAAGGEWGGGDRRAAKDSRPTRTTRITSFFLSFFVFFVANFWLGKLPVCPKDATSTDTCTFACLVCLFFSLT